MHQTPWNVRSLAALLCCQLILLPILGCTQHLVEPKPPLASNLFRPLEQDIQKSYLDLFRISPDLHYTADQISEVRDYLKNAEDYCVAQYEKKSDDYQSRLEHAQQALKAQTVSLSEAKRHDMHCEIQNLRALKSQTEVIAQHAIPVAYDNREAKLELIEQWPGQLKQIRQEIADGSYHNRMWGDVQDIGFRQIEPGQQDDIKAGEEAIKQMKQSGLMPKAVDDPKIVDYVTQISQRIAAHSDLHVPLHVTVLNSKEINAFALPGGFLFVNRGLLETADDEAELAGVMAHETGHVVARHGHKLMEKSTIAQIVYQAAEVAGVVLTGGAASIGAYYALQYGFYGLGLVLNLSLLGVSRDYELQADKLGIQFTWNAGYDPSGFIRFFDKMATKEGYVNGVSWFYDHPPFYERMVDAQREIMFLPPKPNPVVQTPEFEQMKKALEAVKTKANEEEKQRPSLLAPEQGCPAPQKAEYESGKGIETICSVPNNLKTASK